MKARTMIYITTITLFVSLVVSVRVAAQQQEEKEFPRYTVIDLGTLGGTSSSGEVRREQELSIKPGRSHAPSPRKN